ncbi:Hypothetical protein FKW44_015256 [Caligus rogercresseyi]|uniref:Uncharacterized protein n=1 Tax=Caligus rogercresseyi TaxID=217165 RepID=A0A7T8H0W5_CALRO|nr:Hypothetical protein FKW44_015256 [Caligus rogercresseyi]
MCPERYGGLGLLPMEDNWKAFLFSWFKRFNGGDSFWTNTIISKMEYGGKISFEKMKNNGPGKIIKCLKLVNPFWNSIAGVADFLSCKILPLMRWQEPLKNSGRLDFLKGTF